ncbi:MAG: tetratricopeptide repeat protein, partial [Ferruginibacter sp.]
MARSTNYFILVFITLCLFSNQIFAQPTWTLDPFGNEQKPEKYEDKILGSEKTATKKFGLVRHFVQNNVSHYNFYFNAKTKLNTVIERATIAQKDDYSVLLQFYPFSLDNTASQQIELDTVIYKSTSGILLHDLRSDWVDNLYMLVGKSYFYQKKFDSAVIAFQFINYNLFPRKKNEDDGRLIGTNTSASYNVLSIANKEKRNIVQKTFTLPPSRNDALIWLTHALTEQEQYGDAAGLINILHNDPNLPKRLRNDLEEVTAYWFYKQKTYDSAAIHLERGITTAENKPDKARWEFLLGQLYEISGDYDKASTYYKKSIKHTVDPLMDIYARLNDAKMLKGSGNEKELQKSIAKLRKM